MKTYNVELNYISNRNYDLPYHLNEFKVEAPYIERAVAIAIDKLEYHMTDRDDYSYVEFNEDYCEISFGDNETGQDVSYIIREIEVG